MSSATAAVRFPDGLVRWCMYHGTSDVLIPKLHDTLIAAWDDRSWLDGEPAGEVHAVDIATNYGNGFHWRGTATREQVIEPLEPWDADCGMTDGEPEWFRAAVGGS